MPDGEYIRRNEGECHSDMFGLGKLIKIRNYEDMCRNGILRVGYIGSVLVVDGKKVSPDQYNYLKRMVSSHSWISNVFVDDESTSFQYTRYEFLSTNRFINEN